MKILEYLPPVLKTILEIQELAKVEDIELDLVRNYLRAVTDELFIYRATGEGLERWEKALKIFVNESDTIELRRFRILTKLNGDKRSLRTKLNMLIGEENYRLTVYSNNCEMVVMLSLAVKGYLKIVVEMLEKAIPLNIDFSVGLIYNTHNLLSQYTHDQLSRYTHIQLKEEVLKK